MKASARRAEGVPMVTRTAASLPLSQRSSMSSRPMRKVIRSAEERRGMFLMILSAAPISS